MPRTRGSRDALAPPGGGPPWRRRVEPVSTSTIRCPMKHRMPAVCLAFSGGLDTTYCALLLREEGHRVHAVTVDTGGFSPAERRTIAARAKAAGVERHLFVDGRAEVFERYALPLIFGNVLRGGVYPLSVAAERAVQVAAAAGYARRAGARAIAHGSTAGGHDQIRLRAR